MKKPTAIELWNLRMIMVPPTLNPSNIAADQNETKASAKDRDPITTQDIRAKTPVIAKIEYLDVTNQNTRDGKNQSMVVVALIMRDHWRQIIVPPSSN